MTQARPTKPQQTARTAGRPTGRPATDPAEGLAACPSSFLMHRNYLQRLLAQYTNALHKTRNVAHLHLYAQRKGNKRYYYARMRQNSTIRKIYLGTKDNLTVQQLQRRRLLQKLVSNTEADLKALEQLIAKYRSTDPAPVMSGLPGTYHMELSTLFPGGMRRDISAELLQHHGMQLLERKKPLHPEHKTQRAATGERVRSKSEMTIVNCVFSRGIAHLYEPLLLYIIKETGKKVFLAPDLILISPIDGSLLIWEHWGLLGKPGYLERNMNKLKDYQAAGFTPGNNLIITSDTLNGDLDSYQIERILDAWFK